MRFAAITLLLVTALLTACGGGNNTPVDAVKAPKASAAQEVTLDEVLDWAETAYPQFFPVHAATQRYDVYSYRYYGNGNGNYVGISDSGYVVGMGPYVGNLSQPVPLGLAADYVCLAKPSACTAEVAYTVFTQALGTQSVTAQVSSDGAKGSISIAGYGTASTNDDYANVSWSGSVGGALRADGNLLMFCTGGSEQDTRVALSSAFVRVSNLAELSGKSFRENDCFRKDRQAQAGVFTFNADGSMRVPEGETVSSAVRDAFFSEGGLTDPGGTFRAQAWKIALHGQTVYYLVFLNHDLEAGHDSVQFAGE